MSFSFNFELTDEEDRLYSQTKQSVVSDVSQSGDTIAVCSPNLFADEPHKDDHSQVKSKLQPAFEVKTFYNDSVISKLETKELIVNDHVLEIVDTSKLEQLMSSDKEFQSAVCKSTGLGDIVSHSDLVDGVYEGGLKVWECGIDLAHYLSSSLIDTSKKITGKRVLEIGCGAGVPGLYCVRCGARRVDFQDYNVEVLKLLTHTNVENNIDDDDDDDSEAGTKTDCRYFSGDWEEFCQLDVVSDKYDLILSAETIYNVDNYPKLHKVCDKMLANDGVILIAAKEYYFGVGGGVDSFLEYLNAEKCFDYETVWETKTGVPRKILLLKRRSTIDSLQLQPGS